MNSLQPKNLLIPFLLVSIISLILGYVLGYRERANIYKQSSELRLALDKLPESGAVWVITGSEVGRKYSHVQIGNLETYLSTNKPSSQSYVPNSSAQPGAFTYTAMVTNQQVFLSLNTAPDQIIGPFVKKSDDSYTCETQGEGVHSLRRSQEGVWFYNWSHIHMRAETVDANALKR